MSQLERKVDAVLLTGSRLVHPSVEFDARGYAPQWADNLLDHSCLSEIESDYGGGAGLELASKFRAAHSSAALVANVFAPWRVHPNSLQLLGLDGFHEVRFEATFPTGLRGTPPHLDLIADGPTPIAVESKCKEWMSKKYATFSPSYDRLRATTEHSPWFAKIAELRAKPDRFRFLDAAQLVKHALGLTLHYGTRDVRLLYLYWEPRNASEWLECSMHRAEADDFAAEVAGGSVTLIPMSYRELWDQWNLQDPAPRHLPYLRARYDRDV